MKQQLLLLGILCSLCAGAQTIKDSLAVKLLNATEKPPVVFPVDQRNGWTDKRQSGKQVSMTSMLRSEKSDTLHFPRVDNWQLLPETQYNGWPGTKKHVPANDWKPDSALLKKYKWQLEAKHADAWNK